MSLIPPHPPSVAAGSPAFGAEARFRPLWRRLASGALLVVLVGWSVLIVAWLTLHWSILPHIQQWRDPIAARVSKALGVPVTIGAIDVRTGEWVPRFELHDVVFADTGGRPALRLPHVVAALSVRSLLAFELRFDQLLLEAPELEIRRDPAGRLHIAGLDIGGTGGDTGSGGADWFFAQTEFVIRGGSLRWIDEQRGAAPLALTDVRLILRNGLTSHDARLDATPPPAWGDRFTAIGRFTQPLFAPRGDWRRWSGNAYADLPRADVHALRRHADLPFELTEGIGALRGWLELRDGVPVQATVDLALRAVTARLGRGLEPLSVDALEGRLDGRRVGNGYSLALRRFGFETAQSGHWPRGDLTLAWRQDASGAPAGGAMTAERLDVALMAQIAARLPLGAPLRQLLAELDPKGLLTGIVAEWEGALDAPTAYRVRGRLQQGALAAQAGPVADEPGRPGVRGADIRFDANQGGGQARVVLDGGVLELPGVFAEPRLPLDRFDAQLHWAIVPARVAGEPAALSVELREARFANPDASGHASGHWRTSPAGAASGAGGRFPGQLELEAHLEHGSAGRTARYLPLGLPAPTRAYLARAIRGGRIDSAAFHVRGALRDFPFNDARRSRGGEIRVVAHVDDADFAYLPDDPAWPPLVKTDVDLTLDGRTLTLASRRARLGELEFSKVGATIRDLGGDPVLTLDGSGRGALAEVLRIVNTAPIGRWIDRVLERGTASGPAELQLGLVMPLERIEASTLRGSLTLAGNDLRVTPDTPLLAGTRGRVDFTTKGFAVVGARARVFGGEFGFDGGTQPDGSVRFNGQGRVTAEGLRRATELGPVARIAGALAGDARVRASLGFVRGQPDFNVASDLVGMRIELPAPLAKPAEVPLALRVGQTVEPTGAPLRDTLRVELGSLLQASWLRELGGAEPKVLRGGIGLLQPAPQPASGVAAAWAPPRLKVDEWQAALERLFGADVAVAPGGARPLEAPGARPAEPTANPYLPTAITLATPELQYGAHRWTHLTAGLSQSAGSWRANVTADQLAGELEFRPPPARGGGPPGGQLYARLARLVLPKDDTAPVESRPDESPATLPALDVVVDDFEWRGRRLGRVQVEAVNRGRDWELSRFDVATPEAALHASGHWAGPVRGGPRRTTLDFRLQFADSGALLERLGTPGAVQGGKGELAGKLAWTGSPFALDYPTLAGQVGIAVEAGQFLKADPGAARLLGVMSLQSLPRRLSLDFRDVFDKGFAFDSVTGDIGITGGIAETTNLRMRGVQAVVAMAGRADLEEETQDLRVVVVPELNAGTAALATAVLNPALGLGALVAQYLLKAPLTAAGTREFQVSGPWADPKVTPVARKLTDAVPDVGEPASAPVRHP